MPWDALGNLILGVWKSHKAEEYLRAWLSLIFSALITFLFVWGSSILSLYPKFGNGALVVGFGAALVAASASIVMIIRRNPKFKNIALWFPSKVEEAAGNITAEYGSTFDPNLQKDPKP
jgi:hypothetical protein